METSGWWGRLQAGLEKETSALSLSALKPSVRSRSLARGGDKTPRRVPSHPQLPPELKDLSTEVAELFPVPETGEVAVPEEQGSSGSTSISTAAFGVHHLLPGQGVGLGRWGNKGKLPSMVPHLVFLPRILLPLTWYSWSLPTTANGIIS